MEFGILFTSHPNHASEPYPHRDVHARVTAEIEAADRLGYDTAWVAEHHFSNQYGIMPDVFTYLGNLAAKTSRIRLGTAVVTVPLYDPVRIVENMAFVDILSGGRVVLGLGSGYRPYEFDGFGRDFEIRRDVQEEAIGLVLDLLHKRLLAQQQGVDWLWGLAKYLVAAIVLLAVLLGAELAFGQNMNVGRATNADPTYSEGQWAPVSMDLSGATRVVITGGAGSGGTSSTDGATFTANASAGTPVMCAFDDAASAVATPATH